MRVTGWGRDKVERARRELVREGWLEKVYVRNARGRFDRIAVKYRVTDRLLHRPRDGRPHP
jgi:hypothetical protein